MTRVTRTSCSRIIFAGVAVLAFSASSLARLSRAWTYDDLVAEADFVGLLQPLSTESTDDEFSIEMGGRKIKFDGKNTRFDVKAVFKDVAATEAPQRELTLLHFHDTGESVQIANGPSVVYFHIAPLFYSTKVLRDGQEVLSASGHRREPLCIAFLKRRTDGRFEAVTGQEDASESFREVQQWMDPPPP